METQTYSTKEILLKRMEPYLEMGGGNEQQMLTMMAAMYGIIWYMNGIKNISLLHEKLSKMESFGWGTNSEFAWKISVNFAITTVENNNITLRNSLKLM